MEVVGADGTRLRGDLINRVILRTDLTPIPSTVEVECTQTDETVKALAEGSVIKVGGDLIEFSVVKLETSNQQGLVRGDRALAPIKAIGVLNSCQAVGQRLQRSIIRESSSFADIYKSCGATATTGADFPVPQFSAFIGMLPTPEIARVLQEEAAVVFLKDGKLQFRRIAELLTEKAVVNYKRDMTEEVRSDYLDKHALPFAFTTQDDKSFLATKREKARGIVFRPRADARILNNISSGLIRRRKVQASLTPQLNAGARIDVEEDPFIIITAVHVFESKGDGGGRQFSTLYLGENQT